MLEILEAVDGPIRGHAPGGGEDSTHVNRRLEQICNQSAEQIRKQLGKIKISELTSRD
jgi:hypothetical protein